MKIFLLILFCSWAAQARLTYPLQFGLGTDACHPNEDALKVCYGSSPQTSEVEIPLDLAADGAVAYGYYAQTGSYEKMGYAVSVKIVNFPNLQVDDMLTLKVTTWSLAKPDEKQDVELEVFTTTPQDLIRLNLPGKAIGTEDNYSNIILSVRKSSKN